MIVASREQIGQSPGGRSAFFLGPPEVSPQVLFARMRWRGRFDSCRPARCFGPARQVATVTIVLTEFARHDAIPTTRRLNGNGVGATGFEPVARPSCSPIL